MNKKILIIIGILIIAVVIFGVYIHRLKRSIVKECGNRVCESGEDANNCPEDCKIRDLPEVKVAIVYERLNDNRPNRTINEQIQIMKETKADMIFRASWRWNPQPNSCSNDDIAKITGKQPQDITPELKQACINSGYSFEDMKTDISAIKKEIPNIIIIGAVPAQKINNEMEINEITGETFDKNQTWQMALDPAKWGITTWGNTTITKEDFQDKINSLTSLVGTGYYPDITNPDFQELILSWSKRQIDSGMDGIWIDLLFTQSATFLRLTKDTNHPSVKESYEAASKIVDEIHNYGSSKGKYIYVGSWAITAAALPYTAPNLDFVTVTPSSEEILSKKFDEKKWNDDVKKIREKFGDIPIYAFIDWADNGSPTSVFSQKLSKRDQSYFLEMADSFFTSKGINFIYPVHGGYLGSSSTILAYNKYGWYDSCAPQFDTFETITDLAQGKK